MTKYSKANFKTLYGSSGSIFPDNTSGEISESDIRQFGEDVADSFLNTTDENPYRGDFDPTGDVLPTGSTTLKGYRFRTSADYKGWQGIIEARQDNPTTEAHFNFYNITEF